jgi:CheY-specific phosphatase CheX
MNDENTIKSKLLILSDDDSIMSQLGVFCENNNIQPLKSRKKSVIDVLSNNTDLGGIIISDEYSAEGKESLELIELIHYKRPELPIFYNTKQKVQESYKSLLSGVFNLSQLDLLKKQIESHLFTTYYPIPLIRGMQEISLEAIKANIRNCSISVDSPYLVKDQIIYGELMSLIPLESNWYRGYMMLQTTEEEMQTAIKLGLTPIDPKDTDFRFVNSVLNEITNLIWGGIKSRFSNTSDDSGIVTSTTQVPISINHKHNYISFGTTDPQLCFHYQISNYNSSNDVIDIYQKFVFNLSWYPENFQNCDDETERLVESGELELF